jgi:hypothetical protein
MGWPQRGREASVKGRGNKQGHQAERMGGVFSQTRASSLVKGFENAAPVWLAKRRPARALFVSITPLRSGWLLSEA